MERYLSHFSAADYWNVPQLRVIISELAYEEGKSHYTYLNPRGGWKRRGIITHTSNLTLPTSAIISDKGTKVASPELVFLQLANRLSIHRLILLGLQLCSHPPGRPSKAITTKHKIQNFIKKTQGHRGYKKASRAVKYVENGSASIMESLTFMILTLPHFLGGFSLGKPTFNYEIKLSSEGGERLRQRRCFVDLYYKEAKLAVEYDSFAFHNRPADHGKDAIRSGILARQGIEILSLNTIQLYEEEACEDFAYNLASRIGERVQIRTEKFETMHGELRKLLPRRSNQ
jgi:hypothetical protein